MDTGKEIWIINDDADDQELIDEILKELAPGHKGVFFNTGEEFMKALDESEEAPFIILCEVNLPRSNGFVIRQHMLDQPNSKFHGVPFIFWSSGTSENQIKEAFEL